MVVSRDQIIELYKTKRDDLLSYTAKHLDRHNPGLSYVEGITVEDVLQEAMLNLFQSQQWLFLLQEFHLGTLYNFPLYVINSQIQILLHPLLTWILLYLEYLFVF